MPARRQVFSADGQLLAKWGSEGSGNGQFRGPVALHHPLVPEFCSGELPLTGGGVSPSRGEPRFRRIVLWSPDDIVAGGGCPRDNRTY